MSPRDLALPIGIRLLWSGDSVMSKALIVAPRRDHVLGPSVPVRRAIP